ncbi:hypothetical protein Y032_0540g3171 [Ancylostoma ceylanicum]|nr:hypothetical protein Y032_0540g3171 [Ancylostoma ceylanicum]
MAKQKIDYIMEKVRDEKALHEETREAKDLLASLASKIDMLKAVTSRLSSRREQQNVRENAERHSKELAENQQQLRSATIHARRVISQFILPSFLLIIRTRKDLFLITEAMAGNQNTHEHLRGL